MREYDKVNLAKRTDIKDTAGVGVDKAPTNKKGVTNMSGKFNLDKSMDKISAGVGADKAPTNKKQLKKCRSTFGELIDNLSLTIHSIIFITWRHLLVFGIFSLWYLFCLFYGLIEIQ